MKSTLRSKEQPVITSKSEPSAEDIVVYLSPRKFKTALSIIACFLVSINLILFCLIRYLNYPPTRLIRLLSRLFNVADETNIPTLFSTSILLVTAALLFFISCTVQRQAKHKNYWIFLGVFFIFLSVDEAVLLHDGLNEVINNRFTRLTSYSDYFTFAWVIPYAILVIAIGLFSIRFLFSLPNKTRILFLMSGFIYVGGAIGFELIEGHFATDNGSFSMFKNAPLMLMLQTIEEAMEMGGVILFIYSLMDYVASFKTPIILKTQVLK